MEAIQPEPLELYGRIYQRSGIVWRVDDMRRQPDYSVDPKPYPQRPWQVRLTRTSDRTQSYWVSVLELTSGLTRFREIQEVAA